MTGMAKQLSTLTVALALGDGCTPGAEEEDLLAEVGGEQIRLAEFDAFSKRIPEGMREGDTERARRRSILETLIDKKLLVMEAAAARIEEDPWFRRQLEAVRDGKMLALYHRQEAMRADVEVTRQEREEHFRATGRDRSLRFSGVMLESREEALEIIAQLEAGADFEALAAKRSFHRETGERGGDSGLYMKKDDVRPAIAEKIFHLGVGEVSEPVAMPFQGRKRYVVFKIIDDLPVPLEKVEQVVHRELLAAKLAARRKANVDSLTNLYEPRIRHEQIPALNEALADSATGEDLLDSQRDLVLVGFKGGEITVGHLLDKVDELKYERRELADSARVVEFLDRLVIPNRLSLFSARSLGYDSHPALQAFVERKKESLLLSALRRERVDRLIEVADEEARAFYDQHPEKFMTPETWVAAEILVHSDEVARRLKRQLEDGEDAAELVEAYSTRAETVHHGGEIRLNIYTKAFFPEIYAVAEKLEVGEVGGPVRLPNGYSVFVILERSVELQPYDADSQRRARAYVQIDRARRGYVSWVRGLREHFPVTVHEEHFERLVLAREQPSAEG